MQHKIVEFNTLIGKTFIDISAGREFIIFKTKNEVFEMYHDQECCESVEVEDICGELEHLLNTPIVDAYESSNNGGPPIDCDSFTWTFYTLTTIKGTVVIRWLGQSNGYYSESVDLYKITGDQKREEE